MNKNICTPSDTLAATKMTIVTTDYISRVKLPPISTVYNTSINLASKSTNLFCKQKYFFYSRPLVLKGIPFFLCRNFFINKLIYQNDLTIEDF